MPMGTAVLFFQPCFESRIMRFSKSSYWLASVLAWLGAVSVWGFAFASAGLADEVPTQTEPSFYLVGVGPGDADLITVRALRVIGQADMIFCSGRIQERFASALEGKEIFTNYWRLFPYYGQDLADLEGEQREEAERLAQQRDSFVAEVRRAVSEGKTVAILDSGDPLIYGPWAWCLEEFEDLRPVVVPGVSAFNAGNAALGRGITTSEQTKSVILSAADWPGKTDTIERLAAHQATMVLFTMRAEFEDFIDKLSTQYPPETPVAIVKFAGYREREEVIQGVLGTIVEELGDERLPFEYMIYVGQFLSHRYRD